MMVANIANSCEFARATDAKYIIPCPFNVIRGFHATQSYSKIKNYLSL